MARADIRIEIEQVSEPADRSIPAIDAATQTPGRVRQRAFDLLAECGIGDGHALDDRLEAEREICWPAGFEPREVFVAASPREKVRARSQNGMLEVVAPKAW